MKLRIAAPMLLALAAAPALAALPAGSRSVLPWIADDYAGALSQARARKVPIFIESWAPW